MLIRTLHCVILAVSCALLSPAAHSALPDEIQVYTDDINAPGEFGLELHVNTTPRGIRTPGYPGEVVTHRGLRITPEFSYGLAPHWDVGAYLPFVRNAEGTEYFAGPRLRLKWIPVRPAEGNAVLRPQDFPAVHGDRQQRFERHGHHPIPGGVL